MINPLAYIPGTHAYAERKTPDAPMGEVATNDSALYKSFEFTDYNPDTLVQAKGGLAIYDKMRVDDQVKATLSLKKQAVLAPGWDIEPGSDDPKDVEIADFVEFSLEKMQGSVVDMLSQVMLALDYGYSIGEIVWKVYEDGLHAGKVGIRAVKSKRPHYFEFQSDEFGNLKPNGLLQRTYITDTKKLPVNKFLIYSYQKEFDNWYGTSDLRPAYRSWWSKDNIIRFWNIYLERFGSPLLIGKYTKNDTSAANDLMGILNNIQSKSSIVHREGDYSIDMLEAQRKGGGASDYKEALSTHDRGIARAILVPDQLGEGGSGQGAFAKAKVQLDTFLWIVKKLRQDIEETVMNEQLIRRLVGWNFENVETLPKFKFRPLTDDQKVQLAQAFSEAVQKGAVIPTPEDENQIRKSLSFPEKETGEGEAVGQKSVDNKPTKSGPGQATPSQEETGEDQEKQMSKEYQINPRPLTTYEKRVDFKKIDSELKDKESEVLVDMKETLTKQRDALTAYVTNKMIKGELTHTLINGLTLRFMGELKAEVKAMFDDTYKLGVSDGKKELPKKFIKADGMPIEPDEALSYFSAKSDFVVRGIREPLTTATQGILYETIRTGATVPETVKAIQDAYIPYLAEGDVIIDEKQLTSYRLEAIVRTNMSEAYAYGRLAVGSDPELEGFVVGYQFSEILDSRTTDVSRFVDKKIISANHPALPSLTYPLHFNERGVFVFVTKDDGPVTFMSEGEIGQAISMKGI